jgi:hypothetical protein
MKPIFTVHAGEYLVGQYIEDEFKKWNVWIPSKDTGIDILVTNENNKKSVSLQVKLSKDYRIPIAKSAYEKQTIAAGWLTLNHEKIKNSNADFWIIILVSHERKLSPEFIIIPPKNLLALLEKIHQKREKYQVYPQILIGGRALDARGLDKVARENIAIGSHKLGDRDMSKYLNNWDIVKACLNG